LTGRIVSALIVSALIVSALIVSALIVSALIVSALIVSTRTIDAGVCPRTHESAAGPIASRYSTPSPAAGPFD